MQHKLHFSRFEFKYILPNSIRQNLEAELQYFVELDPFVADQKGHKYFVRSLYFDNSCFVNYYEKIDGLMRRAKFRIRTYTDKFKEECPTFLEIKGRHNNLVFKHRHSLDCFNDNLQVDDDMSYSMTHNTTRSLLNSLKDGPLKTQFLFELFRKRLEPMVLVDYWRRPYVSKFDPEFRITFDDNLRGIVSKEMFPGQNNKSREFLPGFTIVEVKFRYHIPRWFHRLIQTLELNRVSISKFCAAVEANNMAPQLD